MVKPVIDLMVGTEARHNVTAVRMALVALGYEDLGEAGVPGRIYLRRRLRRRHAGIQCCPRRARRPALGVKPRPEGLSASQPRGRAGVRENRARRSEERSPFFAGLFRLQERLLETTDQSGPRFSVGSMSGPTIASQDGPILTPRGASCGADGHNPPRWLKTTGVRVPNDQREDPLFLDLDFGEIRHHTCNEARPARNV